MKEKNKINGVVDFLKQYGYILVVSVLLLVFGIMLAVNVNKPTEQVNTPVNVASTSFYSPLLNFTVAKDYNDTSLVYNNTLKQWEAHKGVCFTVGADANVFAVLDGTVSDVYSNYPDGTVVVLDHGNGLKTYYYSLNESVGVKKGDTVKKGAVLGTASASRNSESALGNQLYFEVTENGEKVDPNKYLDLGNK